MFIRMIKFTYQVSLPIELKPKAVMMQAKSETESRQDPVPYLQLLLDEQRDQRAAPVARSMCPLVVPKCAGQTELMTFVQNAIP
jgi:hypothetical protein